MRLLEDDCLAEDRTGKTQMMQHVPRPDGEALLSNRYFRTDDSVVERVSVVLDAGVVPRSVVGPAQESGTAYWSLVRV